MARQGTTKQALEAQKQEQINAPAPTTPATPPATPTPVTPAVPNPQDTLTGSGVASDRVKAVVSARTQAPQAPQSVAPPTPAPTPAPTPTPAPQIIQQPAWNYGTAENPVYAQTPQAPEAKPAQTQPVTTEVGREQAFGQLAKQPEAQTRQAELKSVRENLKDDSGKQLWDNLQSISTSNPNLLQDRNAYNQAFGYDGKDAGEKAMVDSYWRSTRPKSEDIYRSLEAGQGVPQRSLGTSEAVEAIERNSELTKYENLNPYQLSKLIGTELIPGSQVYNDLSAKNPSLITNATKLAQINLPASNQVAPKTNWQDAISQMMQKSPTMQDPMTVEKIMNSDPAISQKTNEVNQYDNQINELTQQQKNLLANITERYKGTGASKATINARYLSESRDLTDQLALLTAQKNSASLALTTLIQNGKDNYEMARQNRLDAEASYYKNMDAMMQMANMGMQQENLEYQRAQQAIDRDLQQMQYWQQREDGFVKDELSFERDLYKTKVTQEYQTKMDERNFNQQKELARMGYQNQRDLANLGFEQGMYEQGTRAQSDIVKELVSKGASYQDAVNQVMWGAAGGGLGDIRHMAGQFPNQAWAKNNNPAGITWNANFDNPKPGTTAYALQQAGIKFSKGTARPANEGGNYVTFDTIEDGLAAQRLMMTQTYGNSTVTQMLQKWVGTSEGPRYAAQVAGNAGVNLNAKVSSLSDAQLKQLQMSKVQKESPGLYKLLQSQQGLNAKGRNYTEDDINVLGEIRAILEKTPTEGRKALKDAGYTLDDIAMLNSGKMPQTSAQKKSAMEVINDIGGLVNMDWNDATGVFAGWNGLSGSDSATANAKIESLVSKLTMPNLGMLKGPMSDKDLAFITSASANLNNKQSDASFEKRLIEYYNISARIAGIPEVKSLEDIKKAVNGQQNSVQPTQGGPIAPSAPNRFEALYNQL